MAPNRVARRTRAVLRSQPVVSWCAVLAVLVVVLRTALSAVPEVVSGGAAWGAVASDLAVAYLAAWLFNVLVIVLPQQRAMESILAEAGVYFDSLISAAARIIELRGAPHHVFPTFDPRSPTGTSEFTTYTWGDVPPFSGWTVREWFDAFVIGPTRESRVHLTAWLPLMPAELLGRTLAVTESGLMKLFDGDGPLPSARVIDAFRLAVDHFAASVRLQEALRRVSF